MTDNNVDNSIDNKDLFDKALELALKIPKIIVDRTEFLEDVLKKYKNIPNVINVENNEIFPNNEGNKDKLSEIINGNILDILSFDEIENLAKETISSSRRFGTLASAALGLPGGFAIPVTISADLVSYILHIATLGQKIAYLYGFTNLKDTFSEKEDLVIFIKLLIAIACCKKADKNDKLLISILVLKSLKPQLISNITTKNIELSKILKHCCTKYGLRLFLSILPKLIIRFSSGTVAKVVPFAGGIINGALSYATFGNDFNEIHNAFIQNREFLQETLYLANNKTSTNTYLNTLPYISSLIYNNITKPPRDFLGDVSKHASKNNDNKSDENTSGESSDKPSSNSDMSNSQSKSQGYQEQPKDQKIKESDTTDTEKDEIIQELLDLLKNLMKNSTIEPQRGSIVYCKMKVANFLNIEHSGIYVGGDNPNKVIIDLHKIKPSEIQSLHLEEEPKQSWDKTYIINYSSWEDFFDKSQDRTAYFAYNNDQIVCSEEIAQKAEARLGEIGKYNLINDNCLIFTIDCLQYSNDAESIHIISTSHLKNSLEGLVNFNLLKELEDTLTKLHGFNSWKSYKPNEQTK